MAVIISVVNGGTVVGAQRIGPTKNGVSHIKAVDGARYVFADVQGGGAPAGVSVKRAGKNLVVAHDLDDVEQGSLVIEDFYGSGAQLVAQGADGVYRDLVAQTSAGSVDAVDLIDGATALLMDASAQGAAAPVDFQFHEAGASRLSGALTGMAAVAGGFGLSNGSGRGTSAPAQIPPDAETDHMRVAALPRESTSAPAGEPLLLDEGKPVPESRPMSEPAVSIKGDAGHAQSEHIGSLITNQSRSDALNVNGAVEPAGVGTVRTVNETPIIDAVVDDQGLIQGVVENGGYTDDGRPQIVGKADPGVLVHIYRGFELIGQVVAGATGEWSFTPKFPLSDGRHVITVVHEYPDGDVSDVSDPYVIFVDKSVPDAPVITGMVDDEGRITGAITEGMITDDNRPTIDGTAEPHATVVVYDKAKEIGQALVDADGKWSFTPEPALADGYHMLSYAAVDRAGNGSERTAVSEFVVDTRPEKVNIYYADDNVGSATGEVFSGGVTDDTTPTLFGTATAGGIVKIYEGDGLLGQVTAGVDGTWAFTPPVALNEGVHTFHATVTLVAKGESAPSKLFTLEVDLTAPSVPAIEQVYDDVGAVQGLLENGGVTDDATPTLSGKAEKGSTVHIFSNGNLLGSVQADASGGWVYTPAVPLIDGLHRFTISATDAAGNQTVGAAAHEIHVDTLRPDRPTIVSVEDDVGQLQGLLQPGDATDDTNPEMKGTAEAHSTVIVRDNGVEIGRVQADAQGEWSFTPGAALAGGAHGITVVSLDKAGNVSGPSDVFDFSVVVVPGVPAAAPTIVSIYDEVGLVKGLLSSGAVTDDNMPLISGKGEPNTTIVLKDNGVEIGRSQVNAAGDWDFLPTVALSFGLHNLVATTIDTVGNSSEPSVLFGFRIAEPGSGGALENFSSLRGPEGLNATYLSLPSGLVAKGQFFSLGNIRHFTPGGMRPEDQMNILEIGGTVADFVLPVESQRISFYHYSHAAKATFLDADGNVIGAIALPSNPGFVKAYFDAPPGKYVASMKIDGGISHTCIAAIKWGERSPLAVDISEALDDGFGGRIVYGKVLGIDTLDPKMALQVTTDGGKTWSNALVREGSWLVMQKDAPLGDWVAEVRIIEVASGLSLGLRDTKAVGIVGAGAPVIERIADAEGMFTQAKAADGSMLEISLAGTGAKQGDVVHVLWGTVTYDHVLTKAEIYAAHATVKVPAEQVLKQGVTKDFSVSVKIIGKDGAIGALSKAYEVVGTYVVAATTGDTLQKDALNNAYHGVGFKITTDGVMAKTSSTASTHAGLTLSDAHKANGLFTLDKPAREVSLRLSGIDSELGVKIQFFDIKGNFIEEQTVYGDATAFHANAYRYAAKDEKVDIGSFRIVASESSVTLDGFTWRSVEHVADSRNPNVIDSSAKSFYGTDGDDLVIFNMDINEYLRGESSGIFGGRGIDTLRLEGNHCGWHHAYNLKISSMEIIEIAGPGNTYSIPTFGLRDVLQNGGTDAFYVGDKSRIQMMVKGNAGKSIYLYDSLVGGTDVRLYEDKGFGGDLGDWLAAKVVTVNGVKYNSYQHSTVAAELLVQQGVSVALNNRNGFTEAPDRSSRLTDTLDPKDDSDAPSLLNAAAPELFSADSRLTSYSETTDRGFGGAASTPVGFSSGIHEVPYDLYLH